MQFLKNLFSKLRTNKNQNWVVKSTIRETEDAITLNFAKPKDFTYKAGQFLIFEKEINGKKIKREYSFSSSPNEELISITAKKIEGGFFSKYLNESIQPNDTLKIAGPKGNFIVEAVNKKYVAFAGGSGITPIFSLIKLLMLEEKSTLHLFYGNQSEKTIIFKDKLNQLVEKYPNRLKVTHVLEKSNGNDLEGIIDDSKLDLFFEKYFDAKEIDEYLICGPGKMIENITNYLKNKNIASNKIKFELFTIPKKNATPGENKITGVLSTIRFKYEAVDQTMEYNDCSETIIDALITVDENIPYSCKNGICGSCIAKVVEGEVNFVPPALNILDEDKIEKGYVLTCCSYPKSSKITLDFNVE